MAKQILLYAPIYSDTSEAFVSKLLEVDPNEDIEILMNSPGGGVFGGWSIIAPLMEREGKINAKVYGNASSMAFYILLFMDKVEALDVSSFLVHRADGYVDNEEDKKFLAGVNKQLREKMSKRLNEEKFKEITGYSFNDIFDPNKRINAYLSAKEAKKIGLVDSITRLEPRQLKAFNDKFVAFADFEKPCGNGKEENVHGSTQKHDNSKTNKSMTKEEFKAQNPDLYNTIFAEGKDAGIIEEKDRVEAFIEFIDIDAKSVVENIKAGNNISNKFMAEMTKKAISSQKLEDIKVDSIKEIKTNKKEPKSEGKTEENKELENFQTEVSAMCGFKLEEGK